MSKQRSGTSTSGRGSQSSGSQSTGSQSSGSRPQSGRTTQDQDLVGTPITGGGGTVTGETRGTAATEQGVKEKAQQLAGQVQQKATQRVESGLARGKTQAAQTLTTVSESLISTGQQLRERNQEPVSRYVDQIADRVQRFSNYLQNTDISEMVDRTEEFARRRPALFLGGAFALGLLGARFLKSSKRGVESGARWSGAGGVSGKGRTREGMTGIDVEVPTSQPKQEWAAAGVGVPGLADVPDRGAQARPFGASSLSREAGHLDLGAVSGGPEASQR
jgi:hypothetical protein